MRRFFIIIILLSLISSCSRDNKSIEIGLIGVLSGRYSEVGVASRNGAELAVEVINRSGGINGRMLNITSIDDKNDKKTAVQAFEKHIEAGRSFIIGPNISHLADETKQYANNDNILIISPTMSTDRLSGIEDNFFRVISVTSAEGTAIADQAIKMNLKRAVVVYDVSNAEYTQPIYKRFRARFESDVKRKIVFAKQVSKEVKENYLDLTKHILSEKPDVVLILTTAIDAAHLSQQIRKSNSDVKLLACRWAKTLDIISQGGRSVEGMVLTSMYTAKDRTPKYLEFFDLYQQKYNTKPSFVSVYAYEAVMVLAESMKRSKSINVKSVRGQLLAIKKFKGLEEEIVINKYGDAERETSLVIIKDGKFEVINE
ncbi:MAG: hypothetical protein C0603_04660 [Denitrovibrio sp.]|nr:MAG: hypothetical protein C0603_04660 [Denitrovibrio sp.]